MRKVTRLKRNAIIRLLKEVSIGTFGVKHELAVLVADELVNRSDEILEEVIEYDKDEPEIEP